MKKEFKGKLTLNKEKISRFESAKITGGTNATVGCDTVNNCTFDENCGTASAEGFCGDPTHTRDGASACKCK